MSASYKCVKGANMPILAESLERLCNATSKWKATKSTRDFPEELKHYSSCGDGRCFGTIRSAVWRAKRIPAIPLLTKTKSRLYSEHQQGIELTASHANQKKKPWDRACWWTSTWKLPFYSKYSVIIRPTQCVSSITIKLGGLWRWEIGLVQLGASRILMEIYSP